MNIQYRIELLNGQANEYRIIIGDISYCCPAMRGLVDNDDVKFLEDKWTDWNKNIGPYLVFLRSEYGELDRNYVAFSYCPFCGVTIATEVTKITHIREVKTVKVEEVAKTMVTYEAID